VLGRLTMYLHWRLLSGSIECQNIVFEPQIAHDALRVFNFRYRMILLKAVEELSGESML
jgi:hypothetical protein